MPNCMKFIFLISRKFMKECVFSTGICLLFLKLWNALVPSCTFSESQLLIVSFIIGLVWTLLDGFFFSGFLKCAITIPSNAFSTKIDIMFGDIFKQNGQIVIAVNDFFDSLVDERRVSSKTLHGQMLNKFWSGNTQDWDAQINESLKDAVPIETINRQRCRRRYEIGTVAYAKISNRKFLCVASSRTDVSTYQTKADFSDIYTVIRSILKKSREYCSGHPVNIPLMGSGLSRTGIRPNPLMNIILIAIFDECKTQDIGSDIRIVLPKSKRHEIDIASLLNQWS